jgi:hypothetical protein
MASYRSPWLANSNRRNSKGAFTRLRERKRREEVCDELDQMKKKYQSHGQAKGEQVEALNGGTTAIQTIGSRPGTGGSQGSWLRFCFCARGILYLHKIA